MTTLVWFRDDLRLADHAALHAAASSGDDVVALYVLDEVSAGTRPLGAATKWWLHESLTSLANSLAALGVPLILRRGSAEHVLPSVASESTAQRVFWNRRYGDERHIDERVEAQLAAAGTQAKSFMGNLLFEPWMINTNDGRPFRVYTPFWRACLAAPAPAEPLPAPAKLRPAAQQPVSDALADWELQPTHPNWATEFSERWVVGEAEALRRLDEFLAGNVADYSDKRNFPAVKSTSELSPYLRWGEISPRTVWHTALRTGKEVGVFLSEVGWREFAWHTLHANSQLHLRGLNPNFDRFEWRQPDPEELSAWQRGQTGFTMVDAGMRELWRTGFMHNRVRMVAASFLTKNLLIDWRVGEAWFWDTLVDADAASNPFSWQWVAGCGADAAPYFRIFNPETQQQKFDPTGAYAERWAPDSILQPPIIDLRASRARALAAYDKMRNSPAV